MDEAATCAEARAGQTIDTRRGGRQACPQAPGTTALGRDGAHKQYPSACCVRRGAAREGIRVDLEMLSEEGQEEMPLNKQRIHRGCQALRMCRW